MISRKISATGIAKPKVSIVIYLNTSQYRTRAAEYQSFLPDHRSAKGDLDWTGHYVLDSQFWFETAIFAFACWRLLPENGRFSLDCRVERTSRGDERRSYQFSYSRKAKLSKITVFTRKITRISSPPIRTSRLTCISCIKRICSRCSDNISRFNRCISMLSACSRANSACNRSTLARISLFSVRIAKIWSDLPTTKFFKVRYER
jgi:hypothetical protein